MALPGCGIVSVTLVTEGHSAKLHFLRKELRYSVKGVDFGLCLVVYLTVTCRANFLSGSVVAMVAFCLASCPILVVCSFAVWFVRYFLLYTPSWVRTPSSLMCVCLACTSPYPFGSLTVISIPMLLPQWEEIILRQEKEGHRTPLVFTCIPCNPPSSAANICIPYSLHQSIAVIYAIQI